MAGKKRNQAILALEQKLRDNPQSRVFSRLADSYRRAGNIQTAVDLCLEGLIEHPDYVTGRIVLGRCYAQQKKYDAAVGELTRVCATDRRNHAAMKMLADIFVRQGRAETAGRIYAILRDMEPDNYSLRQLAAKYRSNVKGNIFEVLGISVNTEKVTQNLMAAGVNPFDVGMETLGSQTIADGAGWAQTISAPAAGEPGGADIEDRLNSMFATQDQSPAPGAFTQAPSAAAGGPSGGDVADQLDMLFGEQPTQAPSADAGGLTGSDVADQLDVMFGQPPKQAPPADAGGLTGSDVADQLDVMFGQPPKQAPPADAGGLTGSDVADQLDVMFGQQPEQAPSADAGSLTGSDVADQLDIMFGQQQQAPSMSADMMAGIDTGAITSAADEPSGSDVADQLDIMFGQQQQAPSMDADMMAGIDTGVITSASDEPSGSDVADQLDIMFGQQQQAAPSMDADAMLGIDTGVISMASDEPSGSDVADQLDIMFGQQKAPSAPTAAEMGIGEEPSGGDIEDRLDALFGNIAATAPVPRPKPELNLPSPMDTLIAEVQGNEAKRPDATDEYFRSELFSEPDQREAAAPASVGEMPAGLFDFGEAETMQFDKSDMLAAPDDVASDAEDFGDAADTIPVEHNLMETITFKPNVPEEGAEIVHGEDIEDRLSELFSDSEQTDVPAETTDSGDDTIEDIVDDAIGVLSADDMTDIENLQVDDVLDEEPHPSEVAAEVSKSDDVDPDIAAILASVDAEVDSTMSGIDTNAIPQESDIVTELSSGEDAGIINTDTATDIDAILASVDAEVDSTMSGIDTNAISQESEIAMELSDTGDVGSGNADTDIDAILASVDAEVDSTMSGIDTNAIPQESEIAMELSSGEDVGSGNANTDIDAILASVDAEVDSTMSGIDTNAITQESEIAEELSSGEDVDSGTADADIAAELSNIGNVDSVSSGHDASLNSPDEEVVSAAPPQPDITVSEEQYRVSEDDVQEKIRQLFKSESSESAPIDVGADFADSAVDERDAPFDLPDHVLTPTLADIYFQQGQPRLALHIYERLALRDPEDERLTAKIQEIQDILLQLPEDEPPPKKRVTGKIPKVTATKSAAGRKKKGAEPKDDRRPLAGVRIKKNSSTSKSKRKPS